MSFRHNQRQTWRQGRAACPPRPRSINGNPPSPRPQPDRRRLRRPRLHDQPPLDRDAMNERVVGVGRNIRRELIKTPSRRHFESKRTSKTGSTSKIGSRNGFVRFGNFCIFRSLSPHGVLNSGHKLTVTYYGDITIEPILNPEFDVDHSSGFLSFSTRFSTRYAGPPT